MNQTLESHRSLINALQQGSALSPSADSIQTVQTHISTVLLTGDYAYKIKKPLNMGFLDFSTLEKRKHFCEEELRLNARLAPKLYLEVVAITGSVEQPAINGDGEVIDYAVKMTQFDQEQLLNQILLDHPDAKQIVKDIATSLAQFHSQATTAAADSRFGQPETVMFPMRQNFEQLRPLLKDADQLAQLERISEWTEAQFTRLAPLLTQRKQAGFIKECHGDTHLGNIALIDNEVTIFDGIEFNDDFRWIDVMSELAFFIMDLQDRGAYDLAQIALNQYLESSGDFEGLALLNFYQTYRAMVRAKVVSLQLAQGGLEAEQEKAILDSYQSFADLAEDYTQSQPTAMLLLHGVSGSGKSTVAAQILQGFNAIHIRSDVERKRLFADKLSNDGINQGLYSPEASEKTYARLLALSQSILAADYSVIVDATFLKQVHRAPFSALAAETGHKCLIIALEADDTTLVNNLAERAAAGTDVSDADENVMRSQRDEVEAPSESEGQLLKLSSRAIDFDALQSALTD